MSSRNERLDARQRRAAPVLSRALQAAAREFADGERETGQLVDVVSNVIGTEPLARLEYAEIVDADELTSTETITSPAVVLLAVWFGDVRLIDNHRLAP
jgi:pantoate--beta-alanine ligase